MLNTCRLANNSLEKPSESTDIGEEKAQLNCSLSFIFHFIAVDKTAEALKPRIFNGEKGELDFLVLGTWQSQLY